MKVIIQMIISFVRNKQNEKWENKPNVYNQKYPKYGKNENIYICICT